MTPHRADPRAADLWTPERAEQSARRLGIDPLLETHWKVLATVREAFARSGELPPLEALATALAVPTQELDRLFRTDTLRVIRQIAGLPDPKDPTPPRSGGV